VSKEHSAFLHGRYILESVVIAHELVHYIHKSKEPRVIIKLDYEKAYDRVNTEFLIEIWSLGVLVRGGEDGLVNLSCVDLLVLVLMGRRVTLLRPERALGKGIFYPLSFLT
jgi:hypothetical protein